MDASSGNPVSWSWDFGNGQSSQLQNPSAVYTQPGKYTVTLTVSDGSSNSTKTKTNYITVWESPTASFISNKQLVCAGVNINFTDNTTLGDASIFSYQWDFGDGTVSAQKNPQHAYVNGGKYNIILFVTDNNGCTSTLTRNQYIEIKAPKAGFVADSTAFCQSPAVVHFTDNSTPSGSSFSYLWTFGDGHSSNQSHPTNTYQNPGNYSVKLKITDTDGCSNEKEITDYIGITQIIPDYSYVMQDSCAPSQLTFQNKSSPGNGLTFYWNFDDNSGTWDKNPVHTFQDGKTYHVTLLASKGQCSNTFGKYITIHTPPGANFIADTQYHCKAPFTVKFSPVDSGQFSYHWTFGDGHISSLQNPTNNYSHFGEFSVSLKVESNNHCTADITKESYIRSSPPGASIFISPNNGCIPLRVNWNITDSSLIPLTHWTITSGNGHTSSNKIGYFTYQDTGKFIVTFKGSNGRGCTYEYQADVSAGMPPVAKFTNPLYKGCNSNLVQFVNLTNTHTPKADAYLWDFGDDEHSTLINPSHKFQDTGWMDIRLIAFFYGCPDTFERHKTIYIYPPIAKIPSPIVGCENMNITDLNKSIGGTDWFWNFGDNTTSTLENPSHAFSAGKYIIKLRVYDSITGCLDSTQGLINIMKSPADDIIFDKGSGCTPVMVSITDTSTQDLDYFWDFGNGSHSTKKQNTISFNSNGVYTVTLTILDTNGCSTTITKKDAVTVSSIIADFVLKESHGCAPFLAEMTDVSYSQFPIIKRTWKILNGPEFNSYGKDTSFLFTMPPTGIRQGDGYRILLQVEDEAGCIENTLKNVVVAKPNPQIRFAEIDDCNNTELKVDANLSDVNAYKPLQVSWYFNNNPAGNTIALVKNFSKDTTLFCKVEVTDALGCTGSDSKNIVLNNKPLSADFNYTIQNSANNCPPVIVWFKNKTKAGSSPVKSYLWDFGNQSTSTDKNPGTMYFEPGNYSVLLLAVDQTGCVDSIRSKDIIRVNGATGTTTVFPTKGCDSLLCNFNIELKGNTKVLWNFSDGYTSKALSPRHLYAYPGSFQPVVILTDTAGCKTTFLLNDTIHVYQSPEVDFEMDGKMTCLGSETKLLNRTVYYQPIRKWEWHMGDGITSSAFEPAHEYYDTGHFDIKLKATDNQGCTDALTKPGLVTVYYDTIPPEKGQLHFITHIDEAGLDKVALTPAMDQDFLEYNLNRTYNNSMIASTRELTGQYDSLIQDTVFSFIIPQCYYYEATDYCKNTGQPSNLHCLIYLTVDADTIGNILNWLPYVGWDKLKQYDIFRIKEKLPDPWEKIATVDSSTLFYLDTNVNCSEKYFYKIVAVKDAKSGFTSRSNIDDATARKIIFIRKTSLIRTSVEQEKGFVEWAKPSLGYNHFFVLYRSADNSNYLPVYVADSSMSDYFDAEINTGKKSWYYHIRVRHAGCEFFSTQSNHGRTILLKGAKTETADVIKLNWNPYSEWKDGVDHYEINYLDPLTHQYELIGNTDSVHTQFFPTIDLMQLHHTFKVKAIQSGNPEIVSNSNPVTIDIEPRVNIPNSFTPNGDGINDWFEAVCYGCKVIEMQIYNRWGEMIYEDTDDQIQWNGRFQNDWCPLGAYVYRILVEVDQKKEMYFGSVTLLR